LPDADFARSGFGDRQIDEFEDFGAADGGELDRFHAFVNRGASRTVSPPGRTGGGRTG
jgi:hypothetical protein